MTEAMKVKFIAVNENIHRSAQSLNDKQNRAVLGKFL